MSTDLEAIAKLHLLKRFTRQISSKNEFLMAIVSGYNTSQDSYKALYSLVYCCNDLLDEHRSRFGPKWEFNQQPSTYVSYLKAKLEP